MRTHRPFDRDRAAVNLLLLITQHVDRPCPTIPEIRAQTGVPKRQVVRFLHELRDRGIIDMEERGVFPGNWRRLRIPGGEWTDWTKRALRRRRRRLRRPPTAPPTPEPAQPDQARSGE